MVWARAKGEVLCLGFGQTTSQILSSLKLASWVFLSLCLFLFHKSSLESAVHPLAYNCLRLEPFISQEFIDYILCYVHAGC